MRAETKIFAFGVVFFLAVAAIYAWWSADPHPEPVGTTALVFTAGLSILVAFYLHLTTRRTGLRPEDRPDAAIEDNAGELGFYSPHSVWPLFVGMGAALVALGLAVGMWLLAIGAIATGIAAIGWVFEYYTGEHAQ